LDAAARVNPAPGAVTLGPDGTLWALHRGSRSWNANSFSSEGKLAYDKPIAEAVVVQARARARALR